MQRRGHRARTGRRLVLAALAAAPWLAGADAAPRRRRIAIFGGSSLEEARTGYEATYAKEFADFGWVEGRTMEILLFVNDYDAKSIEAQARRCVEARPDLIMTGSTARTQALQRLTSTIPIVTNVGDAVGAGFAKSLGRPGGNITGHSFLHPGMPDKEAEILRLAMPALRSVSIIDAASNIGAAVSQWSARAQAAFRSQHIEATIQSVATVDELRTVLRRLPRSGRGAAVLKSVFDVLTDQETIQAAIDLRVPTMVPADLVEGGGMLAFEFYYEHKARRIVTIVDKVLRGADPATIPFELPERSRISVNLRTARAIGISLTPDFLLRADRVFE